MASAKQQKAELSFNNYLMLVVLVCIVAVGSTAFAANTMVQSYLRNQKLITGKTAADKQLSQNIEAFGKLKDQYNGLGATADYLNLALPALPDYPGLVSTVANIAGVSGAKLKSIAPAETTDSANAATAAAANTPVTYPVSVILDGNYAAVQTFLKNMELSARQFKITTVSLTGPSAAQTLTIDILAYHQPAATITEKTEAVK